MDPKMPGERTPHAVSLGLDAAKQVEEYIKVRRCSCRVFRFFLLFPSKNLHFSSTHKKNVTCFFEVTKVPNVYSWQLMDH